MKTRQQILFLIVMIIGFVSCQKKSDSEQSEGDAEDEVTGSLVIKDLSDMPDSTGPVEALAATAAEEDLAAAENFDNLQIENALRLSGSGASIGETVQNLDNRFNQTQNASKAMCETTNQAMKYLFEMGSGDFLNCVIKVVLADTEEIYDGKEHTVQMGVELDQGSGYYKLAIKAKRNTKGLLTGYEMNTCESEDGTSFEQSQHVVIAMTSDSYTYYSKMRGPDGGFSWVDVSANLNEEGKLAGLKNIVYNDHNTNGHTYAEIKQSSTNILYNGATGNGSYYSYFNLIDDNKSDPSKYAVTLLSVGDGAALVIKDGQIYTQGWNGSSFATDTSSTRLIKVEGKQNEIVDLVEVNNAKYEADETFDCDTEVELDLGLLEESVFLSCMERFEIDQEGQGFCSSLNY